MRLHLNPRNLTRSGVADFRNIAGKLWVGHNGYYFLRVYSL
jgi:hypothetical protein